jgi:hypothetical protein
MGAPMPSATGVPAPWVTSDRVDGHERRLRLLRRYLSAPADRTASVVFALPLTTLEEVV